MIPPMTEIQIEMHFLERNGFTKVVFNELVMTILDFDGLEQGLETLEQTMCMYY
jgi:hypothetical protein